jgi:hypothetical protein
VLSMKCVDMKKPDHFWSGFCDPAGTTCDPAGSYFKLLIRSGSTFYKNLIVIGHRVGPIQFDWVCTILKNNFLISKIVKMSQMWSLLKADYFCKLDLSNLKNVENLNSDLLNLLTKRRSFCCNWDEPFLNSWDWQGQ